MSDEDRTLVNDYMMQAMVTTDTVKNFADKFEGYLLGQNVLPNGTVVYRIQFPDMNHASQWEHTVRDWFERIDIDDRVLSLHDPVILVARTVEL